MQASLILLHIATALLLFFIEDTSSQNPSNIVSGFPVQKTGFNFLVAIRTRSKHLKERYGHFCGGSVISDNVVVTAMSCFLQLDGPFNNLSDFYITTGSNMLPEFMHSKTYKIQAIIPHESFNRDTFENDIALVKIEGKFDDSITRINLPNSNPLDDVQCYVSGWGNQNNDDNSIKMTHAHAARVFNRGKSVCYDQLEIFTPEKMLCTSSDDLKGPCKYDEGGPLVCGLPSEKKYLSGIVINPLSCDQYQPSLYTNVFYYKSWIEANTNDETPTTTTTTTTPQPEDE